MKRIFLSILGVLSIPSISMAKIRAHHIIRNHSNNHSATEAGWSDYTMVIVGVILFATVDFLLLWIGSNKALEKAIMRHKILCFIDTAVFVYGCYLYFFLSDDPQIIFYDLNLEFYIVGPLILAVMFLFINRKRPETQENKTAVLSESVDISENYLLQPAAITLTNDYILDGIHLGEIFNNQKITGIFGSPCNVEQEDYKNGDKAGIIKKYKYLYGEIHTINQKVSFVESFKNGTKAQRGIILGTSTIHDVLRQYGSKFDIVRSQNGKTTYSFNRNHAILSFTINDSSRILRIVMCIPNNQLI